MILYFGHALQVLELLLVVLLHVLRLLGGSYLNGWLDLPQSVDVHHMFLHHTSMSATLIMIPSHQRLGL